MGKISAKKMKKSPEEASENMKSSKISAEDRSPVVEHSMNGEANTPTKKKKKSKKNKSNMSINVSVANDSMVEVEEKESADDLVVEFEQVHTATQSKKDKKNKSAPAEVAAVNGHASMESSGDKLKKSKKNKKLAEEDDGPYKKKRKETGAEPVTNGDALSVGQPKAKAEKVVDKVKVPEIGDSFESLRGHVCEATMRALDEEFKFTKLTEVQRKTMPLLLAGRDMRATAKTGSGKTLAFLIPVLEKLKDHKEGVGCIILSPTRELALQIYSVLQKLTKHHSHLTHGIVMGGIKIANEKETVLSGVHILVATPGRLLDHLKNTKGFKTNSLRLLVVDEADRILDEGFERDLQQVLRFLPKNQRQSMLFSATATPKLSNMALLTLKADYEEVDLTGNKKKSATAETLKQGYLVCNTFQRMMVLHKILSENKDRKVIVFLNTCDGVTFYKKVFDQLGLKTAALHGRQGQQVRTKLFNEFSAAKSSALLCTDIAARGWDVPEVDLIVQFDLPSDISEYIHRVGRAVRHENDVGEAVLVLRDEELPLLEQLKNRKIELQKYEGVDMYNLSFEMQAKMEALVAADSGLKDIATRAFRNYLTSYSVLQPSKLYDPKTIALKELAKSFGLVSPPAFNFKRVPLHFAKKDQFRQPKPKTKERESEKPKKKISEKKRYKNKGKSPQIKDNAEVSQELIEKKKKMKERKKLLKIKIAKKKQEMKEKATSNVVTKSPAEKPAEATKDGESKKAKKRKHSGESKATEVAAPPPSKRTGESKSTEVAAPPGESKKAKKRKHPGESKTTEVAAPPPSKRTGESKSTEVAAPPSKKQKTTKAVQTSTVSSDANKKKKKKSKKAVVQLE